MDIVSFTDYGFGSNTYLAVNDEAKEAVLVDAGANAQQVLDYLDKNDVKLVAILLTHGHPDHLISLREIADDMEKSHERVRQIRDTALRKIRRHPDFDPALGGIGNELAESYLSIEEGSAR